MTRARRLIAAAAFLAFVTGVSAAAEDYEIRLTRPARVGRKYRLSASGRYFERRRFFANDKLTRDLRESFSVDLESVVTVLEADKRGVPTRLSCAIGKCVKTERNAWKPLIPKGKTVIAFSEKRSTRFSMDGQPVSPEIRKALKVIIAIDTGATDDDVFGSRERRKVGDSWDIDAKAAAKDAADAGVRVRKDDITGSVSIEKLAVVDGSKRLLIRGEMAIRKAVPPMAPGFIVDKGTFEGSFTGAFPLDLSVGRLENAEQIAMFIRARRTDAKGRKIVIESTLEKDHVSKMTYLK